MNERFRRCLERRQVYRADDARDLVEKERVAVAQDLAEARASVGATVFPSFMTGNPGLTTFSRM